MGAARSSHNGGKRPGSGRPQGARTRVKAELAALARKYTPKALQTLVSIMNDESRPAVYHRGKDGKKGSIKVDAHEGASNSERMYAAVAILDRGHGKPPQAFQHGGEGGGPVIIRFDAIDAKA